MDKRKTVAGRVSRASAGSVTRGNAQGKAGATHLLHGIRRFAGKKNAAIVKTASKTAPASTSKIKAAKGSNRGGKGTSQDASNDVNSEDVEESGDEEVLITATRKDKKGAGKEGKTSKVEMPSSKTKPDMTKKKSSPKSNKMESKAAEERTGGSRQVSRESSTDSRASRSLSSSRSKKMDKSSGNVDRSSSAGSVDRVSRLRAASTESSSTTRTSSPAVEDKGKPEKASVAAKKKPGVGKKGKTTKGKGMLSSSMSPSGQSLSGLLPASRLTTRGHVTPGSVAQQPTRSASVSSDLAPASVLAADGAATTAVDVLSGVTQSTSQPPARPASAQNKHKLPKRRAVATSQPPARPSSAQNKQKLPKRHAVATSRRRRQDGYVTSAAGDADSSWVDESNLESSTTASDDAVGTRHERVTPSLSQTLDQSSMGDQTSIGSSSGAVSGSVDHPPPSRSSSSQKETVATDTVSNDHTSRQTNAVSQVDSSKRLSNVRGKSSQLAKLSMQRKLSKKAKLTKRTGPVTVKSIGKALSKPVTSSVSGPDTDVSSRNQLRSVGSQTRGRASELTDVHNEAATVSGLHSVCEEQGHQSDSRLEKDDADKQVFPTQVRRNADTNTKVGPTRRPLSRPSVSESKQGKKVSDKSEKKSVIDVELKGKIDTEISTQLDQQIEIKSENTKNLERPSRAKSKAVPADADKHGEANSRSPSSSSRAASVSRSRRGQAGQAVRDDDNVDEEMVREKQNVPANRSAGGSTSSASKRTVTETRSREKLDEEQDSVSDSRQNVSAAPLTAKRSSARSGSSAQTGQGGKLSADDEASGNSETEMKPAEKPVLTDHARPVESVRRGRTRHSQASVSSAGENQSGGKTVAGTVDSAPPETTKRVATHVLVSLEDIPGTGHDSSKTRTTMSRSQMKAQEQSESVEISENEGKCDERVMSGSDLGSVPGGHAGTQPPQNLLRSSEGHADGSRREEQSEADPAVDDKDETSQDSSQSAESQPTTKVAPPKKRSSATAGARVKTSKMMSRLGLSLPTSPVKHRPLANRLKSALSRGTGSARSTRAVSDDRESQSGDDDKKADEEVPTSSGRPADERASRSRSGQAATTVRSSERETATDRKCKGSGVTSSEAGQPTSAAENDASTTTASTVSSAATTVEENSDDPTEDEAERKKKKKNKKSKQYKVFGSKRKKVFHAGMFSSTYQPKNRGSKKSPKDAPLAPRALPTRFLTRRGTGHLGTSVGLPAANISSVNDSGPTKSPPSEVTSDAKCSSSVTDSESCVVAQTEPSAINKPPTSHKKPAVKSTRSRSEDGSKATEPVNADTRVASASNKTGPHHVGPAGAADSGLETETRSTSAERQRRSAKSNDSSVTPQTSRGGKSADPKSSKGIEKKTGGVAEEVESSKEPTDEPNVPRQSTTKKKKVPVKKTTPKIEDDVKEKSGQHSKKRPDEAGASESADEMVKEDEVVVETASESEAMDDSQHSQDEETTHTKKMALLKSGPKTAGPLRGQVVKSKVKNARANTLRLKRQIINMTSSKNVSLRQLSLGLTGGLRDKKKWNSDNLMGIQDPEDLFRRHRQGQREATKAKTVATKSSKQLPKISKASAPMKPPEPLPKQSKPKVMVKSKIETKSGLTDMSEEMISRSVRSSRSDESKDASKDMAAGVMMTRRQLRQDMQIAISESMKLGSTSKKVSSLKQDAAVMEAIKGLAESEPQYSNSVTVLAADKAAENLSCDESSIPSIDSADEQDAKSQDVKFVGFYGNMHTYAKVPDGSSCYPAEANTSESQVVAASGETKPSLSMRTSVDTDGTVTSITCTDVKPDSTVLKASFHEAKVIGLEMATSKTTAKVERAETSKASSARTSVHFTSTSDRQDAPNAGLAARLNKKVSSPTDQATKTICDKSTPISKPTTTNSRKSGSVMTPMKVIVRTKRKPSTTTKKANTVSAAAGAKLEPAKEKSQNIKTIVLQVPPRKEFGKDAQNSAAVAKCNEQLNQSLQALAAESSSKEGLPTEKSMASSSMASTAMKIIKVLRTVVTKVESSRSGSSSLNSSGNVTPRQGNSGNVTPRGGESGCGGVTPRRGDNIDIVHINDLSTTSVHNDLDIHEGESSDRTPKRDNTEMIHISEFGPTPLASDVDKSELLFPKTDDHSVKDNLILSENEEKAPSAVSPVSENKTSELENGSAGTAPEKTSLDISKDGVNLDDSRQSADLNLHLSSSEDEVEDEDMMPVLSKVDCLPSDSQPAADVLTADDKTASRRQLRSDQPLTEANTTSLTTSPPSVQQVVLPQKKDDNAGDALTERNVASELNEKDAAGEIASTAAVGEPAPELDESPETESQPTDDVTKMDVAQRSDNGSSQQDVSSGITCDETTMQPAAVEGVCVDSPSDNGSSLPAGKTEITGEEEEDVRDGKTSSDLGVGGSSEPAKKSEEEKKATDDIISGADECSTVAEDAATKTRASSGDAPKRQESVSQQQDVHVEDSHVDPAGEGGGYEDETVVMSHGIVLDLVESAVSRSETALESDTSNLPSDAAAEAGAEPAGVSVLDKKPPAGVSVLDKKPLAGVSVLDKKPPAGVSVLDKKPPASVSVLDKKPPAGVSVLDKKPPAGVSVLDKKPPPADADDTSTVSTTEVVSSVSVAEASNLKISLTLESMAVKECAVSVETAAPDSVSHVASIPDAADVQPRAEPGKEAVTDGSPHEKEEPSKTDVAESTAANDEEAGKVSSSGAPPVAASGILPEGESHAASSDLKTSSSVTQLTADSAEPQSSKMDENIEDMIQMGEDASHHQERLRSQERELTPSREVLSQLSHRLTHHEGMKSFIREQTPESSFSQDSLSSAPGRRKRRRNEFDMLHETETTAHKRRREQKIAAMQQIMASRSTESHETNESLKDAANKQQGTEGQSGLVAKLGESSGAKKSDSVSSQSVRTLAVMAQSVVDEHKLVADASLKQPERSQASAETCPAEPMDTVDKQLKEVTQETESNHGTDQEIEQIMTGAADQVEHSSPTTPALSDKLETSPPEKERDPRIASPSKMITRKKKNRFLEAYLKRPRKPKAEKPLKKAAMVPDESEKAVAAEVVMVPEPEIQEQKTPTKEHKLSIKDKPAGKERKSTVVEYKPTINDLLTICQPCSVLLVDFIKCLDILHSPDVSASNSSLVSPGRSTSIMDASSSPRQVSPTPPHKETSSPSPSKPTPAKRMRLEKTSEFEDAFLEFIQKSPNVTRKSRSSAAVSLPGTPPPSKDVPSSAATLVTPTRQTLDITKMTVVVPEMVDDILDAAQPYRSTAKSDDPMPSAPYRSTAKSDDPMPSAPYRSTAKSDDPMSSAPYRSTAKSDDPMPSAPYRSTAKSDDPMPSAPTSVAETVKQPAATTGTPSLPAETPPKPVPSTQKDHQSIRSALNNNHRFRCVHCNYGTNNRNTMQEHLYNHTDVVPFSCGKCGANYGTRSGIVVHNRREHEGPPIIIKVDNNINEESYFIDTQVKAATRKLTIGTTARKGRRSKKSNSEMAQSQESGGMMAALERSLAEQTLSESPVPVSTTIPVIPKMRVTSSTPTSLVLSSVAVTPNEKPTNKKSTRQTAKPRIPKLSYVDPSNPYYQCRYCTFASNTETVAKSHVDQKHQNERVYVCPLCELAYCKHEEAMRRHFRKWHPKDPVYLLLQPGYYDVNKKGAEPSSGAGQPTPMDDSSTDESSSPPESSKNKDSNKKKSESSHPPIILKVPNIPYARTSPISDHSSGRLTPSPGPDEVSTDEAICDKSSSLDNSLVEPSEETNTPAETVSHVQEAVQYINNMLNTSASDEALGLPGVDDGDDGGVQPGLTSPRRGTSQHAVPQQTTLPEASSPLPPPPSQPAAAEHPPHITELHAAENTSLQDEEKETEPAPAPATATSVEATQAETEEDLAEVMPARVSPDSCSPDTGADIMDLSSRDAVVKETETHDPDDQPVDYMCKEVSSTSEDVAQNKGDELPPPENLDESEENPFGLKILEVVSLAPDANEKVKCAAGEKELTMYSCKMCLWVIDDYDAIVSHIGIVHRIHYVFGCPYCHFGCSRHKVNMLRHIRRAHPHEPDDINIDIIDEDKYILRQRSSGHGRNNDKSHEKQQTPMVTETIDINSSSGSSDHQSQSLVTKGAVAAEEDVIFVGANPSIGGATDLSGIRPLGARSTKGSETTRRSEVIAYAPRVHRGDLDMDCEEVESGYQHDDTVHEEDADVQTEPQPLVIQPLTDNDSPIPLISSRSQQHSPCLPPPLVQPLPLQSPPRPHRTFHTNYDEPEDLSKPQDLSQPQDLSTKKSPSPLLTQSRPTPPPAHQPIRSSSLCHSSPLIDLRMEPAGSGISPIGPATSAYGNGPCMTSSPVAGSPMMRMQAMTHSLPPNVNSRYRSPSPSSVRVITPEARPHSQEHPMNRRPSQDSPSAMMPQSQEDATSVQKTIINKPPSIMGARGMHSRSTHRPHHGPPTADDQRLSANPSPSSSPSTPSSREMPPLIHISQSRVSDRGPMPTHPRGLPPPLLRVVGPQASQMSSQHTSSSSWDNAALRQHAHAAAAAVTREAAAQALPTPTVMATGEDGEENVDREAFKVFNLTREKPMPRASSASESTTSAATPAVSSARGTSGRSQVAQQPMRPPMSRVDHTRVQQMRSMMASSYRMPGGPMSAMQNMMLQQQKAYHGMQQAQKTAMKQAHAQQSAAMQHGMSQFLVRPNRMPPPAPTHLSQTQPRQRKLSNPSSMSPGLPKYPCPYCPFEGTDADTIHDHILSHAPNIDWVCPYCPVMAPLSKTAVAQHIHSKHPGCRVVFKPYGVPR